MDGTLKLLSVDQLKLIEGHLAVLVARVFPAVGGVAPLNQLIREYVLAGGKRIRPQLCVWTYERVQDSGCGVQNEQRTGHPFFPEPRTLNPEPLLDLACGWELFHTFLLVHDDIIDNADVRRDAPALHRSLASLDGHSPKFGMNLGIVAGDLLFSAAMRLWHEIDLPAEIYKQELRLFSHIACMTGFGQAIDICQSHVPIDRVPEELLLREYHWKTAAYTFEGPMLTGAILAGADEAAQHAISRYALALGQAYQLQNDLIDLAHVAHAGSDLVQGKRTVALLRARVVMDDKSRREFDDTLDQLQSGRGDAVALAEDLRLRLKGSGAAEQTRVLIARCLEESRAAASEPTLLPHLAAAMMELLDRLAADYFI
jgi:geranylgeranyl diphosphate synthase type I